MLHITRRLHAGLPVALSFNITHRCNLACLMCNIHQSPIEELPLSDIERIMTDIAEAGFQVIEITGGEPFLRKDIFEIFAILERLGLRYTLNTNGILLTRKRVERLRDFPGILQIAVSIDSLRRDVFALIRGADRLPSVLRGLERLRQLGPRVPIKVNLTVNRFNYVEIDEYLSFCSERDLYLSVFPVNLGSDFRHRSFDNRLIPTDEEREGMARMFHRLVSLRKQGKRLWEHSAFYRGAVDYIKTGFVPPCDAGRLFFDLHADGKIAVCNDLPPFGDLKTERFRDCCERLEEQQDMIRSCYRTRPCYYTCTYAISAIARHKVSYIMENLRAMGISGFMKNFAGAGKSHHFPALGPDADEDTDESADDEFGCSECGHDTNEAGER